MFGFPVLVIMYVSYGTSNLSRIRLERPFLAIPYSIKMCSIAAAANDDLSC